MRLLMPAVVLLAATTASAKSDENPLRTGLEGALRGCVTWVLEPSSWLDGPSPFLGAIGLEGRVSEAAGLPEPLLPPPNMRRGARYWRIGIKGEGGYALVVSADIPMCHITGGGRMDLQPAAEAAIAAPAFAVRWRETGQERTNGIISTFFTLRDEPKLRLVFSRADAPDARRDRPQVIVTAIYDLEH